MTTRTPARSKKADVVKSPEEADVAEVKESPFEAFLEHQRTAISEASKAIVSLLPVAFKEHGEAAVHEAVEGYRTLVNSTIDEIIEAVEKIRIESDKAGEKVVSDLQSVKEEVAKV